MFALSEPTTVLGTLGEVVKEWGSEQRKWDWLGFGRVREWGAEYCDVKVRGIVGNVQVQVKREITVTETEYMSVNQLSIGQALKIV